jgi:multidrug efflux system membrane fusion protein
MFVRVRLPIGKPHPALLVIDRAIGSEQGLKYVYVVDQENKVQQRRVETGPLQDDGLRVIASGLKADDWVVVGGIQQVRPRMVIVPDKQPMPTLEGSIPLISPTGEKTSGKSAGDAEKAQLPPSPTKGSTSEKSDVVSPKSKPPGSAER